MFLRPLSVSTILGLALVAGGGYAAGSGLRWLSLLMVPGVVFVSAVFERRQPADWRATQRELERIGYDVLDLHRKQAGESSQDLP